MIISFGDFTIHITPTIIIYPIMLCLILIGVAAIVGFLWVCLTPAGDPLFNIPKTRRGARTPGRAEDAEVV